MMRTEDVWDHQFPIGESVSQSVTIIRTRDVSTSKNIAFVKLNGACVTIKQSLILEKETSVFTKRSLRLLIFSAGLDGTGSSSNIDGQQIFRIFLRSNQRKENKIFFIEI